jgi:hypothetical protein
MISQWCTANMNGNGVGNGGEGGIRIWYTFIYELTAQERKPLWSSGFIKTHTHTL